MAKQPLLLFTALIIACSGQKPSDSVGTKRCVCDTTNAQMTVQNENFNSLPEYDTELVSGDSLYGMTKDENRRLWYRDVENPDTTKFTKYWNAYVPVNYHADQYDFIQYYDGKPEIEIAFQFGPNYDLWAYHIFVAKNIDCCYLLTRSYFRHARFVYKAYTVVTPAQLDTLYSILQSIERSGVDKTDSTFTYRGYFVDNRHDETFLIDFENQVINNKSSTRRSVEPKKEVMRLYDFVDNRVKWKVTYR